MAYQYNFFKGKNPILRAIAFKNKNNRKNTGFKMDVLY